MSSTDYLHRAQAIDALAETHLLKPNPLLTNALSTTAAAGIPPIQITPLAGQYLALQLRLMNATRVLEIGALGGYSTIWLASTGAHVTSIEIDPKHRDVAKSNTASFGDKVEIILGAALEVLPKLKEEGREFDFVFVDAVWEEQMEYFEWAVRLLRKGGVVYVDNVVRELLEDEEEGGGGKTLLEKVGELDGVTATLVTTISGTKEKTEEMMDGFILAVVD